MLARGWQDNRSWPGLSASSYPSPIGSMIDRQGFLRRNYFICSFVLSWTLRKRAARLAAFSLLRAASLARVPATVISKEPAPNPDHRNGNADRAAPPRSVLRWAYAYDSDGWYI